MRFDHPDGKTAFFVNESTIVIGELDYAGRRYNGPRWVSIGHIGSSHGLLIGPTEWKGFLNIVHEIDKFIEDLDNKSDGEQECTSNPYNPTSDSSTAI